MDFNTISNDAGARACAGCCIVDEERGVGIETIDLCRIVIVEHIMIMIVTISILTIIIAHHLKPFTPSPCSYGSATAFLAAFPTVDFGQGLSLMQSMSQQT